MRPVAENGTSESNVRGIMQLLGEKGLLAQSANGELLIALKAAELGFSMPIAVATLPTIGVSSMPSLVVSTMPSLTANPTRPTLLVQVLLTASDATLYTAAANWRDVVIYAKNVDTANRTCDLALNATYSDTTALVKSMPIEVGGRVPIFLPALASAQVIRGLCDSANKVSVEIWGVSA